MNLVAVVLLLSLFVSCCHSDFTCLCNYNVETPVYKSADASTHPIGYMYEFDCKYLLSDSNPTWISIAFEHKIGFIENNGGTKVQTCPGEVPERDKLTTTTVSTTKLFLTSIPSKSTTTETTLSSPSFSLSQPPVTAPVASSLSSVSLPSSSFSLPSSLSSELTPASSLSSSKLTSNNSPRSTFASSGAYSNTISTSLNMASPATNTTTLSSSTLYPFSTNVSSPTNVAMATTATTNKAVLSSSSLPFITTLNSSSSLLSSLSSSTQISSNIPSSRTHSYTGLTSSISYTSTNISSSVPSSKITAFTPHTADRFTSATAATSISSFPSLNTSNGVPSYVFSTANSSTTLYNLLTTSFLPPMPSTISAGGSTKPQSMQANDSFSVTSPSTQPFTAVSSSNITKPITNDKISLHTTSAKMYSTARTTIYPYSSTSSPEFQDSSITNTRVSTSAASTNLVLSSKNKMTSSEALLSSSSTSPVVPYTQFPETSVISISIASFTSTSTISTVLANRTVPQNYSSSSIKPGAVSDRVDLCPYKNLAMSMYNSTTYRYPLFRQYGNYCYELRLELGSWLTGQSDCVSRGGELATIESKEVQARVYNLSSSLRHKMDIWIGLHDLYKEGRWEWVNGEELTTSSYNNGIVINRVYNDARDCVVMDGTSGVWKNVACKSMLFDVHTHPWICQYKMT